MTWIKAQAKIDQGLRMLEGANKLIQEGREMMERVNAEVSIRPIKEGKIECERGGMYNERPHVQLQPGDNSTLSFEQPKTWERD